MNIAKLEKKEYPLLIEGTLLIKSFLVTPTKRECAPTHTIRL